MQEICLISGLAFGIIQPLNVFGIMERLGLEKEKTQGFVFDDTSGRGRTDTPEHFVQKYINNFI